MNNNFNVLLNNEEYSTINKLIKLNIITMDYAVKQVISSKNAEYIYFFAIYVKGAPIGKLTNAIIETKNAEYIYKFAIYVEGAPIDKLADAIIETKNVEYIYFFARNVKGAPIGKLTDAIIETKDVGYIFFMAKYVDGAPKERLLSEYKKLANKKEKTELEKLNELIKLCRHDRQEEKISENKNEYKKLFYANKES